MKLVQTVRVNIPDKWEQSGGRAGHHLAKPNSVKRGKGTQKALPAAGGRSRKEMKSKSICKGAITALVGVIGLMQAEEICKATKKPVVLHSWDGKKEVWRGLLYPNGKVKELPIKKDECWQQQPKEAEKK